VLQRDDADLARLALGDLADLLGRDLRPVTVRVVRWGGALPQPAVGHVDAMERALAAVAAVPGLALAGAAVGGVGIPACIATASRAADAVLGGGRGVHGRPGGEE
jgi:oxygen-dependent protoporphyrinogen oxidase